MDSLSTILRSIRLRGSLLSLAELSAPWGVETSGIPRAAIFHALLVGRAELRRGGETIGLEAGDIVVLTRGDAHVLADGPTTRARPIRELARTGAPVPTLTVHGGGAAARILCGVFHVDHAASDSFLSLLPEVLHLSAARSDPRAAWVRATLAVMADEVAAREEGSGAVITRMADVLFVELLRSSALGASRGWLAALHDPQIGRALALLHDDPRARWEVGTLAARVGMSRSRFFARFTELVGEPPAAYLTRWRMNIAADLIRREDLSSAHVAEAAGYASEEAFARTFRRHLGMSPAEYRRSLRVSA